MRIAATTQSTTRQNGGHHGDIVAPVLPEVFAPMAGEPEHQQPRRSGDACCGDDHKDRGDRGLDGDHGPPSVGDREADVDRRDHGQRQRIDGRRIKPPQAERRRGLDNADHHAPQHPPLRRSFRSCKR
jgi:hypothetical protein